MCGFSRRFWRLHAVPRAHAGRCRNALCGGGFFGSQSSQMCDEVCTYMYLGKLQRPHCDLTGIMVSIGNHPQMALIQVSEIL